MWIKDIRNYEIEVYRNDELVYSGNANDAPDDIKNAESQEAKMGHKKIIIKIS